MASRSVSRIRRPGKRIIVACDGTWLNSNSGDDTDPLKPGKEAPQIPSNVTRICRAINAESFDGLPQVVYYQAGVGTGMGLRDKVIGGSTGQGLSEHIREAYDFIANNYLLGDEIFLLGFSRGAYTARSVASLIKDIGILTKSGLSDFFVIFKDWQGARIRGYRSAFPDTPFPDKPSAKSPEYLSELVRAGLTTPNIPIKAVGVWDTVGALGIPRIGIFEVMSPSSKQYMFEDTIVGEHVENAFQALALDEEREPFAPAVWEKPRGSRTYLKQVWFPGVHSNIGGGYEDQELANITLAWMIEQLTPFLDFDEDFLPMQVGLNREYYLETEQMPRPWSFGEIYNSRTGVYELSGKKVRTPGNYNAVDLESDQYTERLLSHTNEYIHASVRARWGFHGPGVEDRGQYKCEALRHWENAVVNTRNAEGERQKRILWEEEPHGRHHTGRVLYEDLLGEIEKEQLMRSPDIMEKIVGRPRHIK